MDHEIIERDPPYRVANRIRHSVGFVFHTSLGSPFESEDPGEWITGIENYYAEFNQPTPFHFYITRDGEIYEGLGWGVRGRHMEGAANDPRHTNDSSHGILYLGAGETFTWRAAAAARFLIEEHMERYGAGCKNVLAREHLPNSKSGGDRPRHQFSLAEWLHRGCPPPPPGHQPESIPVLPSSTEDLRVDDLRVLIADITDSDYLTELLESEKAGKDRTSAKRALETRLGELVDPTYPTEDSSGS